MSRDELKIEIRAESEINEMIYDLLLLSDESKAAIDKNLDNGELYVAKEGNQVIAAFILKTVQEDALEIRNIAVAEELQGKGIGTLLLRHIIDNAGKRGFKSLWVGTCDQCSLEIKFYEKSGFVVSGVRKNFFLENYDRPIYENGKQIVDMILLKMDVQ